MQTKAAGYVLLPIKQKEEILQKLSKCDTETGDEPILLEK